MIGSVMIDQAEERLFAMAQAEILFNSAGMV